MNDDLYRLIYYSRNRLPAGPDGPVNAIHGILAASRTNNEEADVTGALLFNAGCFGQVLEGNRRAIEATFERIQCDPRHGDVSLLAFEPADRRAFGNWSMAFVGADRLDAERYGEIADASGYDPSRMSADSLFETLHRLTLEEEQGS